MSLRFDRSVIPAKAGIQSGLSDVRRLRLDSRLRGNDVVRGLVIAIFAVIGMVSPSVAQDRPLHGVALVIGESKYEQLPVLGNPQKDARDIDRLLGDLGFDVDRVLNADGDELREAIERFTDEARDADVALVYYSGHGIEAKGENFIAPTDTDISSPQKAGESMIAVQPLLEALSKAAPISIVLLDACRSDPFPAGQMIVLPGDSAPTAVSAEGLAAVRGPTPVARPDVDPNSLGSVIGFAAEPGEPALDGAPGENSPYAAALLKHFAAGGYSFGDVMTMVSEEVYLKTKAKQLPWVNSSLRRVLTFGEPEDTGDVDQTAIKTERRKLLLSIATTPPATQKYVEALAGQEQVPLDALYGMLGALGIKTNGEDGDIQQQMQKGAERLKELIADKPQAVKSDDELERLSRLADDAEAEGAIALALKYRDQASARADVLLKGKQEEAEQLRQDMIDIADTYAANAATALLNFDQLHAAELYGKAYEAVADWDKQKAFDFKLKQGDALTDRGYYNIDNEALNAAVAAYEEALDLTSKEKAPLDWGKVENRIGQAQQTLGARLGDVAILKASIASFTTALTAQTKAASPDDWAMAENNLGNVLYSLGFATNDQAVLQQSVDAFDQAATVFTADYNPVRWSTVVSNRGGAMLALADAIYGATDEIQVKALEAGEKDIDNLPVVVAAKAKAVAILGDIIVSLDGALKARPRADNPLDWAMIAHTRASAYADRGKLTASADDFEAAVALYRDVLTVHDKQRTPVQWTTSATNLAATLRQYAALTKDLGTLDEAGDLLRQSIALTPVASSPLDWARMQNSLGNVLSDRLGIDGKAETADAAIAAYEAAETVRTVEADPSGWEQLQLYEVQVLLTIATPTMDVARLKRAYEIALNSKAEMKRVGATDSGFFDQMLPVMEQMLAMLGVGK